MKRLLGLVLSGALFAGSGVALAQQTNTDNKSATQHAKDAGHQTKEAAKSTGKAVKKGTKKGVNKAAKVTKKGASKVEGKTETK